ncbi:MAG: MFS transporter [Pyrinomonadaceae bacterium]
MTGQHHPTNQTSPDARRAERGPFVFIFSLLLIEFLDELLFGVREAAWPLIRDDLRLSYTQVGLLLSVPGIVGNLIEPGLGILADVWRRRVIVLCGGAVFAAATLLVGLSHSFTVLLAALVLLNPASGAFVSVAQASLMDAAPRRHEQNMARWTFSGSLGNVIGPLAVGAALAVGLGWRTLFVGLSIMAALVLANTWRFSFPTPARDESAEESPGFKTGLKQALRALRRREVLRWLVLLEVGDFTNDILRGFLALYFVDVVGVTQARAALAVIVWTTVGLPGDFLLIPLLERVRGLSYLRWSTASTLVLFPALLLVDGWTTKLVLLGMLGLANAGWYSILKARLYSEMPGQSGTVMTLGGIFGLAHDLTPLLMGAFAERYGLGAMMWLLVAGPALLLVGLLTAPKPDSQDG